jgi:hypothetical protein
VTEALLRKLLLAVVEAYEKTYLDATILWALLEVREIPNLERKLEFFRHDQMFFDFVRSKFQPLYDLLGKQVDEEALRKALSDIPSPKKPN